MLGCELCAFACPADAIWVEGEDNDPEHPTSPGSATRRIPINYLRCIMCGLCVEACPSAALTLTSYFEMAYTSREDAILTKEQLLEPPPKLGTTPRGEGVPVGVCRSTTSVFLVFAPISGARPSDAPDAKRRHAALFPS